MTRTKLFLKFQTLNLFAIALFATSSVAQSKYSVIYNFTGGNDGAQPMAALVADSSLNLYGTAHTGGAKNSGTIFELTPGQNGWTETTIYTFQGGSDGYDPVGGLIVDAQGNLYGTTIDQSSYNGCVKACGTVFRLSPSAGGTWTKTILYRFKGLQSGDGANPFGTLVFDKAGNLYGTTYAGGVACVDYVANGCGTVFELSPASPGSEWTETLLYVFSDSGANGIQPEAGVTFDKAGNLYGTTYQGASAGVVFQLAPPSLPGAAWTYHLLDNFGGLFDGAWPLAAVMLDAVGNVYGTTSYGGDNQNCYADDGSPAACGTVFQLTPNQGSDWEENLIYQFQNNGDGAGPFGALTADNHGNLYTTTEGAFTDYGTIVQLKLLIKGGNLTETTLHQFGGKSDGRYPYSGVIVADRALFGTTTQGGTGNCSPRKGCGTVYEVVP